MSPPARTGSKAGDWRLTFGRSVILGASSPRSGRSPDPRGLLQSRSLLSAHERRTHDDASSCRRTFCPCPRGLRNPKGPRTRRGRGARSGPPERRRGVCIRRHRQGDGRLVERRPTGPGDSLHAGASHPRESQRENIARQLPRLHPRRRQRFQLRGHSTDEGPRPAEFARSVPFTLAAAGGMGAPRLLRRSALLISLSGDRAVAGNVCLRPALLRQLLFALAGAAPDPGHALGGPSRRRGARRRERLGIRLLPERDAP